ncbi:MAG: hypothetical protein ACJAW8_002034 [Oleispira sp.]|jgi:hypothetical protein
MTSNSEGLRNATKGAGAAPIRASEGTRGAGAPKVRPTSGTGAGTSSSGNKK